MRSARLPGVVDEVGVDDDQLDVRRLGGLGEPPGPEAAGPGRCSPPLGGIRRPDPPARRCRRSTRASGSEPRPDEPGEDGTTRLEPGNRARRFELHQRLGGGELDPAVGGE